MTNPYTPASQPQDPVPYGQPDPGYSLQPDPRYSPQPAAAAAVPRRAQERPFAFDGGAGTYFGTAILAMLVTVCTLGICYPFAVVLRERWRAKHSFIEGRQLVFNGSAWGLFGLWLKWLVLIIVTIGIYSFWVSPRIYRWRWENTSWAP
jgi:uncharacterized membrane protein YjgN (DUF898 family)